MKRAVSNWQLAICTAVAFFANCKLQTANAQGIHFSQYYNAPMLLNPANTALMPDKDFRIGANYRNQWAAVPVPYVTYSGYADFQLNRNRSENSWLGIGVAFFSDKVGDGELSLTRPELFAAYHVLLGNTSMISVGLSGAYCQRSLDYSKLSFDEQWDGFSYSSAIPSGETRGAVKTKYADFGAGVNYAYFPNENVYVKVGLGLAHLNQPVETFYGAGNRLAIRPTGNIDALFRLGEAVILNPSVYYTRQTNASELVYGTLVNFAVGDGYNHTGQFILGAFHRVGDAVLATAGYEWGGRMRLMASYDVTTSSMSQYVRSNGGFELSLRYQGLYLDASKDRKTYNCPRL